MVVADLHSSFRQCVRFKFTKLSPTEPNKAFSFLLTLAPSGSYMLSNCEPNLETKKTDELVQVLNSDSDNGLMYFLVGMRKFIPV